MKNLVVAFLVCLAFNGLNAQFSLGKNIGLVNLTVGGSGVSIETFDVTNDDVSANLKKR